MVLTNNIQAQPGWSIVTGPSIGPAVPAIEISQSSDGFVTALLVNVTGVPDKYADGMVRSAAMPLPANTGSVITRIIFAVDDGYAENSQALEVGLMATTPGGAKLNGALQLNNSLSPTESTLDVTVFENGEYLWGSTSFVVPKFAPNVFHVLDFTTAYDLEGSSTVSVDIDGAVYAPAVPIKIPAQALEWQPNIYFVECQPDINENGGTLGVKIYYIGTLFS